MTTIFDSAGRIKSARKPHIFGAGIPVSDRRAPFSAADAAWWAANSPSNGYGYQVVGPADSILEEQAAAFVAQARLDAGAVL